MKSGRSWTLAILGPAVAYALIAYSISLSPWFSWASDALSDLGHSTASAAAPYYNFGLFMGGFLLLAYGLLNLRLRRPFTALGLVLAALTLQSVGMFDEIYGALHGFVSVAFFALLWATMILYAVEARSLATVAPVVAYMLVWALYWMGIYGGGVAIPETASSAVTTGWLVYVVAVENLGLLSREPAASGRRSESP